MHEHEDIKGAGLRVTLPRIAILEIFRSSDHRHLSAEEIYRLLVNQGSNIGLATVYRVLAQLEEAGVLARNSFNAGKAVFELDEGKHHDHMICLACGRTDEFNDPTIEKRQKAVAEAFGYLMQGHRLELYGYCPDCLARRSKI